MELLVWQWVHTMRIEIRNITIDSAQNSLEIDKHVIHYLGNPIIVTIELF